MTNPQPVQLSTAQLEKLVKNLEARLKAKTLECASLGQLKLVAGDVVDKFFNYRSQIDDLPNHPQKALKDAVYNYLTAKLNQELINLEELELRLKQVKAASNMVQPAIVG